MFIAFLVSIMGREASLGVMASAFGSTSVDTWSFLSATVRAEGTPELATALLATISRPEALAFIYAFFFGVPCFMTVAATIEESRSIKWTLRMVAYYVAIALILAAAAFRIGLFLDGKGRNACGRTPAWERGIDVAGNVFRRNFGEDPC
jgi:ferrous iron transport protein B